MKIVNIRLVAPKLFSSSLINSLFNINQALPIVSVTRLGDLLDFGQPFKASGNTYFAQISYILRQFL